MECVIKIDSQQYRIKKDSVIYISYTKHHQKEKTILFDKVLYLVDNGKFILGKPYIPGALVEGIIEETMVKGPKLQWIKYAKSSFMRKKGHRQKYTKVRITSIKVNNI
ncbi:MAG: 50S ribosomal protein L21 [Planctomycetota bacterium]